MSFLRRNMLKKIGKYQYGIFGSVKKRFIDIFDNISSELCSKSQLRLINMVELRKQNTVYFNETFLDKFNDLIEYCANNKYDINNHKYIDDLDKILIELHATDLPLCKFMIYNELTEGKMQYYMNYCDIYENIESMPHYKVYMSELEKYYK